MCVVGGLKLNFIVLFFVVVRARFLFIIFRSFFKVLYIGLSLVMLLNLISNWFLFILLFNFRLVICMDCVCVGNVGTVLVIVVACFFVIFIFNVWSFVLVGFVFIFFFMFLLLWWIFFFDCGDFIFVKYIIIFFIDRILFSYGVK